MAKSFLLKMQFIVSDSLRSSAVSCAILNVLFPCWKSWYLALYLKVTRALVDVDIPLGFFLGRTFRMSMRALNCRRALGRKRGITGCLVFIEEILRIHAD